MLKLVASKVGKSSRLGNIHDSVYNHVISNINIKNLVYKAFRSLLHLILIL